MSSIKYICASKEDLAFALNINCYGLDSNKARNIVDFSRAFKKTSAVASIFFNTDEIESIKFINGGMYELKGNKNFLNDINSVVLNLQQSRKKTPS